MYGGRGQLDNLTLEFGYTVFHIIQYTKPPYSWL